MILQTVQSAIFSHSLKSLDPLTKLLTKFVSAAEVKEQIPCLCHIVKMVR